MHCRQGTLPDTISVKAEDTQFGGFAMLNWVVTLLIIALIAAVLGFGGIAGTAIGLAKLLPGGTEEEARKGLRVCRL